MGELKGDDVPAATRMRTYRVLHGRRLLGLGDKDEALWKRVGYDLSEVFELIGLDIKMFYGGPREAVMHAIYRQNYGFSDLVIGRKHADAPYEDGEAIWGDFDAQEIFDRLCRGSCTSRRRATSASPRSTSRSAASTSWRTAQGREAGVGHQRHQGARAS